MVWSLRIAFGVVLVSMLLVTGWASSEVALWKTPRAVATHPWFIATLFDTYFAFLTFYAWLAYKETSWLARILWLLAILALGNIAMSIYMLILLVRLPTDASFEQLLLRKKSP
jgi:predicted permease